MQLQFYSQSSEIDAIRNEKIQLKTNNNKHKDEIRKLKTENQQLKVSQ